MGNSTLKGGGVDTELIPQARLEMVEGYLQEIEKFFKWPRRPVDRAPLETMHKKKDYAGMMNYIKNNLLLRDLNLTLAKVKGVREKGYKEHNPAWLIRPNPVYRYGTNEFKKMPVVINIWTWYLQEAPFTTLVAAVSHELSHIVLESTDHPLKYYEEAVDLTAMYLGYHEFFPARQIERDKQINGVWKLPSEDVKEYLYRLFQIARGKKYTIASYLSLEEVCFAHDWIKRRLEMT